jgi:hypothetical protein
MQKQRNDFGRRAKEQFFTLSRTKVFLLSFLASFLVLTASLVIQWLVYDDWLQRTGPLRIVGTSIAAVVTFGFVLRWQLAVIEKQREMVRRFEMIAYMNDRIRNALQAITCVTYISQPEETDAVREAVEVIDEVLREVISDAGQFARSLPPNKTVSPAKSSIQKSA